MKKLASNCACSASGIGICLCIVFMTISVASTTLVGISKNANSMAGMETMHGSVQIQNIFVDFFSGIWGEAILLVSFGLMCYGMWSSGGNRKKLLSLAVAGIIVLYVSMYVYFSLTLEIVGSIILAFSYASVYSYRIAKAIKLA